MIIKASQRGGAIQLGLHLLKTEENEHVDVHDMRGFMSSNLVGALQEIQAISRGTKCRQYMFSTSFNPPQGEKVTVEQFEAAIEITEQKLGLDGYPRVIVFHEKEGRRHAHVVWSRISAEKMTAINLSHFKMKLQDVSRQLYLEHGWKMPSGFMDRKNRNPLNFTQAEWQQAKRTKQDPKLLKAMFQECWAISQSRQAFAKALETKGLYLAQGDQRGFVAVDYQGEVYAISRYTNKRTKEIKAKLGDPKTLPTVEKTKALIASRMTNMLRNYIKEVKATLTKSTAKLDFQKAQMVQNHQVERKRIFEGLEKRQSLEVGNRARRLSKGFKGLWDRLTGKYAHMKRQNEVEAWQSYLRDQKQKEALISSQLNERGVLQKEINYARKNHSKDIAHLHRDIAHYMNMVDEPLRSKDRSEPEHTNGYDLKM